MGHIQIESECLCNAIRNGHISQVREARTQRFPAALIPKICEGTVLHFCHNFLDIDSKFSFECAKNTASYLISQTLPFVFLSSKSENVCPKIINRMWRNDLQAMETSAKVCTFSSYILSCHTVRPQAIVLLCVTLSLRNKINSN